MDPNFRQSFAWRAGCLLGASGVLLGAFGSHGLKKVVNGDLQKIANWKTASNYQLLHSVVLLIIGVSSPASALSAKLITGGTLGFSGSIYLLTLNPVAFKLLGPVTPLGGLSMIAGWVSLLF
ncbi:DUF423-domain-containing protein [Neoconidiobolus thromboides FSU 785]|nr:DUF423-domain-containing protein [Neoconidiobolus thromboides FSU 785]